jgi:hypothetical protein
MGSTYSLERRDPAAGVLELGRVLASARRNCRSGQVEVRDQGRVHAIRIATGAISDVALDEVKNETVERRPSSLMHQAQKLFDLRRPHVLWFPGPTERSDSPQLDPASVVFTGVAKRSDLFDPRPLVERIPVDTLRIDPSKAAMVKTLPLERDEFAFLERLTVPTPVSMILWKRGLDPERAAVLLVALNLIGLFEGDWEPGDLPRLTAAVRISRRVRSACSDCELLGVKENAPIEDVDRAFRMLSLDLHPDRLTGFPAKERAAAQYAYQTASAAYARIRRSRRSRPVAEHRARETDVAGHPANGLAVMVAEARASALRGDSTKARAYALKALALAPTYSIKMELCSILKRVA